MYLLDRTGFTNIAFASDHFVSNSVVSAALDGESGIIASVRRQISSLDNVPELGRWNADGTRDWTFTTNITQALGANPVVNKIVAVPGNSNFIAAVQTTGTNNTVTTRLVLLSHAGELISRFNQPMITGAVNAIAFYPPLPGGLSHRIIIGGDFSDVGTVPSGKIAMLDGNGVPFWAAAPNQGADGAINDIQVQLDGAILVGGAFTQFAGLSNNLVRLHGFKADGVNFLYWESPEIRAYERDRLVTLTAVRAGATHTAATYELTFSGAADLVESPPHSIQFAPGESIKEIRLTFFDDTEAEETERLSFAFTNTPLETVVTRRSTEISRDASDAGLTSPATRMG